MSFAVRAVARRTAAALLALLPAAWAAPAAAAGDNLVANGDFEQADPKDPRRPLGWDLPDGLGVRWAPVPAGEAGPARGRAVWMNTRVPEKDMEAQWRRMGLEQWHIPEAAGNAISDTYGLSFYSQPIPVVSGMTYRISFLVRRDGAGEGAKVWVRGYGRDPRGRFGRLYEKVVFCRCPAGGWTRFEQDFNPTLHRPLVTEMKVMLYAYHPPGEYGFDDVRIEALGIGVPVAPTPAPTAKEPRR